MAINVPSPCIVDTNVALVANGASDAGTECVVTCTQSVHAVVASGHIVLDDGFRIIGEYRNKLRESGQPGPGDAFLKWVLSNLANRERCTQVAIRALDSDPDDFEEVPGSLRDVDFDRSDRKFIAVAIAHGDAPSILQAVDSKWWQLRKSIEGCGVSVVFLCEEEVQSGE